MLPRQGGAKWLRDRTEYLKTLRIRPLWFDDGHFDAVPEFLRELTGRRRTPRGKRRAREVDRFIRTADELERRLAACTSADEKIEVFFANHDLLRQGGLPRDYIRIGRPILRLARRARRDCAALNIANNVAAAMLADDPRRLHPVLRLCAELAKRCRAPELLDDLAATALRKLAVMEAHAGATARARRLFLQSIERAAGLPQHQSRPWADLGAMLDDRDDLDGAEAAHRQAATISRRTGRSSPRCMSI